MPITKIIYSLRIMLALRAAGFEPLTTMPNPQHPEFNCWVFELTEDLQAELDKILGGTNYGRD
jgi:hypothetical protein